MRRNRLAFLALIAASRALATTPDLPIIPSGTFPVAAATGNATTDTANLNAAITAAKNAGGGRVQVPAGTYLSNQLTLFSNINLNLAAGATIQNNTTATLIKTSGSNLHDIQISGSGIIDGRATTTVSSNNLVDIRNVNRLAINGVTIQNSTHFHLVVQNDDNMTIDGVKINDANTKSANGGNYLSNTDGIDYSGNHVLIQNCNIDDGDDNIVAKPSSTACSDILINNCTIGKGHGISVGGQTNAGLNGLTVTNCTFNGTDNGVRLKAGKGQGGIVKNVVVGNVTMTNVKTPIIVNSWYDTGDHYGSKELSSLTNPATFNPANPGDPFITVDPANNTDLYPFFQGLYYHDITATGATNNVVIIYGLNSGPDRNILGLSFNNVNLSGTYGADIFYVENFFPEGLTVTATKGNAYNYYGSTFPLVPEPASVAPLLAAGALLLRRRKLP